MFLCSYVYVLATVSFVPDTVTGFVGHTSGTPGSGCSKLTTSLVNVSLKFQKLISQICQCFLSNLSFFQQKISVYLVIKS